MENCCNYVYTEKAVKTVFCLTLKMFFVDWLTQVSKLHGMVISKEGISSSQSGQGRSRLKCNWQRGIWFGESCYFSKL